MFTLRDDTGCFEKEKSVRIGQKVEQDVTATKRSKDRAQVKKELKIARTCLSREGRCLLSSSIQRRMEDCRHSARPKATGLRIGSNSWKVLAMPLSLHL